MILRLLENTTERMECDENIGHNVRKSNSEFRVCNFVDNRDLMAEMEGGLQKLSTELQSSTQLQGSTQLQRYMQDLWNND